MFCAKFDGCDCSSKSPSFLCSMKRSQYRQRLTKVPGKVNLGQNILITSFLPYSSSSSSSCSLIHKSAADDEVVAECFHLIRPFVACVACLSPKSLTSLISSIHFLSFFLHFTFLVCGSSVLLLVVCCHSSWTRVQIW